MATTLKLFASLYNLPGPGAGPVLMGSGGGSCHGACASRVGKPPLEVPVGPALMGSGEGVCEGLGGAAAELQARAGECACPL